MKFVQGDINQGQLQEMIGNLEETAMTALDSPSTEELGSHSMGKGSPSIAKQGSPSIKEVKSFKEFDRRIDTIAPISITQAWIGDS